MNQNNKKKIKWIVISILVVLVIIGCVCVKHYFNKIVDESVRNTLHNSFKEDTSETEENKDYSNFDGDYIDDAENRSLELIDSFEYAYDDENFFSVDLMKDTDTMKKSVWITGYYSKENIGLMKNDFLFCWAYPFSEKLDINVFYKVGEEYYSYGIKNGELIIHTIPLDNSEDIPEGYIEKFENMRNEILDFYIRNGLYEP